MSLYKKLQQRAHGFKANPDCIDWRGQIWIHVFIANTPDAWAFIWSALPIYRRIVRRLLCGA